MLYSQTVGPIHRVTVQGRSVHDVVVYEAKSELLTNATSQYAVVVVPRATPTSQLDGQQLGLVDLSTGKESVIDTGPGEALCCLVSPDQTEVLLEQEAGLDFAFLIVDLASHTYRRLEPAELSRAYAIRWTPSGIVFGTATGVLRIDPQSSGMARVSSDAQRWSASPDGTYLGGTKNANPTDANWCSNTIVLTRAEWTASGNAQRPSTTVVAQPNKDFTVLDVGDDGSVLYTETDCRPGPTAPGSDSRGLYYFSQGRSVQQFGIAGVDWGGRLIGASSAVLERRGLSDARGSQGGEVDLTRLCSQEACTPESTVVAPFDAGARSYIFAVIPSL